jgi:UDP-glucuronate decarboxylase
MSNILITGGAGNIGSALAEKLVKDRSNMVMVVDDLSTGSLKKLPFQGYENFRFIKADINDPREISPIMLSNKFDFVFHYAAVVGVKRTLENPISVLNDIDGIRNILSLSKNTGVKRIFYSSSSEVYGEPVEFPQNEYTTPLNSRLPYAIVKNLAEAYIRSYQQEYGLDYTIFRFFNTYGPNQSTDFVMAKFLALAYAGHDIPIYGQGSQTRTFCYVKDNIDVTAKCLVEDHCVNDVLNVGNHIEYSVLELALKIIELTGSRSKVIYLPPLKEGDMVRRLPDNSKMLSILNRPLISLEEGIMKMIDARMLETTTSPIL